MKKSAIIMLNYILFGPLIGCVIFPFAMAFSLLIEGKPVHFVSVWGVAKSMFALWPITLTYGYILGLPSAICTGLFACTLMRKNDYNLARYAGYFLTSFLSAAIPFLYYLSTIARPMRKPFCLGLDCHYDPMLYVIACISVITACIMLLIFRIPVLHPKTSTQPSNA